MEKTPGNNRAVKGFDSFLEIVDTLRSPEGCPWDREQTAQSLRTHLIEESYEAVEAIDENDADHVREELGDVLLLVGMISRIYEESGQFSAADVIEEINAKLIRRHPHVFGDEQAANAAEVLKHWERVKVDIEGRGEPDSVLDRINKALPPLERCYKIQTKVARKGFDWPDISGPLEKISEELAEIEDARATGTPSMVEEEVGDLIFSVVNYARHLGVNPALALARTNAKFEKRFRDVEKQMENDKQEMCPANIDIMDAYWDSAKSTS